MIKTEVSHLFPILIYFAVIFLLFRVLDEFHFHLKWYQSEWTRVAQPLSCPALLNLKSGREELRSAWNQVGERSDFYPSAFVYSCFFLKDWVHLLFAKSVPSEVPPWWALKGEILRFGSPDPWKMHFQHTFWLQRTSCTWLISTIFLHEYYGLVIKYMKSHHPNRCIKVSNKPPKAALCVVHTIFFCNQTWPGRLAMLISDFSFLCMSKLCSILVIYS